MRKSPLCIAINLALMPGVQLATSRVGPVSPYHTHFNRQIYYHLLGEQLMSARSVGKTLTLPLRYSPRNTNA